MCTSRRLIDGIRNHPILLHTFQRDGNGARGMVSKYAQKDRTHLSRSELLEISLTKLFGAQRTAVTKRNISKNTDCDIKKFSSDAFNACDDLSAIQSITNLKGVGVPVGSALLAWCFPHRWPVIDRHAWGALHDFGLVEPMARRSQSPRPRDYVTFCGIIRPIAQETGRSPQQIDTWLFSFRKCGLQPSDLT